MTAEVPSAGIVPPPAEPDIAPVPDISGHFRVPGRAAVPGGRAVPGQSEQVRLGGSFAPEALAAALTELTTEYEKARNDPGFQGQLEDLLVNYAGRPSLLTEAANFSEHAGVRVFLKREDLNHTGSHKINNVLGQVLLAKRMGKTRVIAETGAGQHGVATATAAALLGLECAVYMGETDMKRQALNVARMRMLGSEVIPVTTGTKTLKDAMNDAFRDWVATVGHTHYCIGSVGGPHPFPMMVRDFQRIIGVEARKQILEQAHGLPDALVACVGGGSNAIGLFHAFIPDEGVALVGCEAGGDGPADGRHAATLTYGSPGVLHGMRTYVLQDDEGQTLDTHSISAGLDYPGVGPEHAWLKDTGRATYFAVSDKEAMDAFGLLCRTEGIIPAIESSHALAGALAYGKQHPGETIIVNLSGRGDKDMETAAQWFQV